MDHRVVTVGGEALASRAACLVGLGLLGGSAPAGQDGPIDFEKARQLRQRVLRGEPLDDEGRAYLERARAAFREEQAGARNGSSAAGKDSRGLTPLTDLAGEARDKGQVGGLYGGRDEPPEDDHDRVPRHRWLGPS